MPDTSKSTNPAAMHYRGLDLEAMTALQMRNVEALRNMTTLMLDTTEAVTRRQAEFFRSRIDKMSAPFEAGKGISDPQAFFEHQIVTYRDLFEEIASHVRECAEITSQCSAALLHEASREARDQSGQNDAGKKTDKGDVPASKVSAVKK